MALTPAGATMAAPCMKPANIVYMPARIARSYSAARPASAPNHVASPHRPSTVSCSSNTASVPLKKMAAPGRPIISGTAMIPPSR